MELVTITCKEDIELCVYQLKSIHKYVEPCIVNVVVNELDIKFANIIINKQKKRMPRHTIKIWSRDQVFETDITFKNGWISQQLIKLLMPLDNDYIVLDCKDIFLKHTLLSDIIKLQYKSQPNPKVCKTWGEFFSTIHKKTLHSRYETNLKIIGNNINDIQTPRLIKKSVILEIISIWKSKKKFIRWWSKLTCIMSEFMLYDYIAYCKNENLPNNQRFKDHEIIGIWNMNIYHKVDLKSIKEETRILKIHKRVFNNPEVNYTIQKWLDEQLSRQI